MKTDSEAKYDFIIVGAGPAGCSLASHLAASPAKPSVLLLEAGGDNSDINARVGVNRFIQIANPELTYPYESVPQYHLGGRALKLERGRGLGGSSCINFTLWDVGARDDWEKIAQLTGDNMWNWQNVQKRFRELEDFHGKVPEDVPPNMEKYVCPKSQNHGSGGLLRTAMSSSWESFTIPVLETWESNGYTINKDASSGDRLGMSIGSTTCFRGTRSTASDLLLGAPPNLQVVTNAIAHRVLFEDSRAVGVVLVDEKVYRANHEVILSAGTLDTPKILMHSGIGSDSQLSSFGIPLVHQNPHVGRNYMDHYFSTLRFRQSDGLDSVMPYFRSPVLQAKAMKQWQLYRDGECTTTASSALYGFFKSDAVMKSREYADLPTVEQARLRLPTIPTYEIAFSSIGPECYTAPDTTPPIINVLVVIHNSQGLGHVELKSKDPTAPLEFHPACLTHPYDQRVAIEATREVLKVIKTGNFLQEGASNASQWDTPATDDEEDILKWWRERCGTTWHMSGTCKMAQTEDEGGVVDSDFRVFGVNGLRVVDMSIMPIMLSAHTQAAAYQVGMIAAEKLIKEYDLLVQESEVNYNSQG
ncbi:uncharacterized protein TRIVIDRAFT_151210 [Trichoderma virens Gv29-8]|uniref:Glucose-methanol-choline oxidoreductase N-terminal domain-containing protein n=1 Tax=Hypocrea virens (strain Gv29-8 / FGSC 10586) TaxID=413071 RepID=G9MTZ9_HYPVG|nr:uncharacterized protein TRIVIDRAFT_151210 [Trichoderma virens Gv29-8]EHK22083.1 hypothetical protein TRIVIDRAFT_151210 [Trichoderma virens Gv29-8]UKZ57130.1 hypothetical protein TrVGV298_010982 [Trichoderma virens]